LRQLTTALKLLAGADTVYELRRRACREAARTLGYGSSAFSVIRQDGWTITDSHPSRSKQQGPIFISWNESPAEYEAHQEKTVVLTKSEPTTADQIRSTLGTDVYLVASVSTSTRRIALLHFAHPRAEILDFVERDVLKVFASAVATIHERIERNQLQRSASEATPRSPLEERLTARERDVFRLLVSGASNRDIADQLVITVDTVKSHVKRVLHKTGSVNRAEIISLYLG
jgi:DNA-binding NarL/FixJ family response regulator